MCVEVNAHCQTLALKEVGNCLELGESRLQLDDISWVKSSFNFFYSDIPEATQSTTIHIEFVPPVSDLPSLVEVKTSTTRDLTTVVFALVPDAAL